MKKPLLILDLDETLIYSTTELTKDEICDFVIGEEFYVKKRPFVDEFLIEMSEHFELAVWTAATRDYGSIIVKELFHKNNLELQFFHSREKCVERSYIKSMYDYLPQRYYIKDLKKIKKLFNLDKVLMIDDLHISLERNYGNLIKIKPFQGDIEDNQLILLQEYLISIKEEENLRKIEKRNWHNNISTPTKKMKI